MIKSVIKTCQNCAYRSGQFRYMGYCMRTGKICTLQRQYPNSSCDENFSGWVERQKPWIQRLLGL